MGLRMKNYGIHRKIQFLGRGSQKKQYRLKVLLGKKEGGGVFVGALIPQCTLWKLMPCYIKHASRSYGSTCIHPLYMIK